MRRICRLFPILLCSALLGNTPFSGTMMISGGPATLDGTQILLGNSQGPMTGLVDHWIALGTTGPSSATSIFKSMTFPVSGTLKSMIFKALTTPSGGSTWVVTIYLNGVAAAPSCTVTSGSGICTWRGGVAVAAGDYAAILVHPTSTPTTSVISTSVGWTPTTANDTIILGSPGVSTFSTTQQEWIQPFDSVAPGNLFAARRTAIMPDGGTLSKFCINSVAPGVGKSYKYDLYQNISATSVTATMSNAATSVCDNSHSVTVAAGDFINFGATPTGTPTGSDAGFGALYLPTTVGSYAYMTSNVSPPNATRYAQLDGAVLIATEADVQNVTHAQTFTKLNAKVTVAPGSGGSGKSWTMTLRVNGVNSALACTILDAATTCSATGIVVANDNDMLSMSVVPANTPGGTDLGMSLLANR